MERNIRFDIVRAIAIICVLFIHSMALVNIGAEQGDVGARLSRSVLSIVYSGVPMFVLLSGALLLGKEEPIYIFFKKRLSRVLIPFVVWSVIIGAIIYIQNGGRSIFGFGYFLIKGIFTTGVHQIYWYIYMLIGLYLLTPALRIIASRTHVFVYLCTLCLFVKICGDYMPWFSVLSKWMCENMIWLFYYMSGYVIITLLKSNKEQAIKSLFVVSFPIIYILGVVCSYFEISVPGRDILQSIVMFGFILSVPCKPGLEVFRNLILTISKYSYGIYLSHFMFISAIVLTQIPYRIPLYIEPFLMVATVLILDMAVFFVFEKSHLEKYVM